MEVEALKATEGLIQSFGFPVAMVLVLLGAMGLVFRAVKGFLDKKDTEAVNRETRLVTRLEGVENDFRAFMNTTAQESARAINRMAEATESLQDQGKKSEDATRILTEAVKDLRRDLGSSDRRRAIGA